ncbi:mucosa-associated lymphoid tissue lymphoma translocation protein 1-like [Phymastichus coffea]|uniref:mucosa-associated lymphoid tissue lymphoma translocation protein 1-like n=1 Tax=Phymastichus coffea TaxID=108790 RepID=UPI00273B20BD|nr:mucosa-associated lymphoid tissue lymphoma translocation protein 1-like [Phymastichus coffea]XP_058808331.1 mucosa-associated lymphoid tissue lymphoma translocation protein 1-like [Phymastichus coffea]XP_058808332.1 mucosa-associated lymphoid tissue lymphoma translocation protein 1-like [Phymastichus coffea]XP_058808333.1 mucosa-associated lymphoid tissue lymphoma translocation protein 1-like [Phymastichus coffea]
MLKFDEDLSIDQLPLDVYEAMIDELNRNKHWKIVANHLMQEDESYSASWISCLESQASSKNKKSPAENLLIDLNIRLGDVLILDKIFNDCNLKRALSFLHYPEKLYVSKHPDDNTNNASLQVSFGKLSLKCEAEGLPPPSYQWYQEDKVLENETTTELSIDVQSEAQEGTYKCRVYQVDHRGDVIFEEYSKPVYIKIKPMPVTIMKQPPTFLEVKENDNFILHCEASCYPSPKFQWYKDNERLDNQTTDTLTIEKFSAKGEGKYYCHISNYISERYTQQSTVLIEQPRQKATVKVALLIANENYDNQEVLRTPRNDVAKVSKILNNLNFHVICLTDLTLVQMRNAIRIFCDFLIDGAYGLFYFAGHGFRMQENYMLPVDTPTNYLRKDAISESLLLSMALKSDPALLVVILDMCQTAPPAEQNPEIHEELPAINEFKGKKNLRNLLLAYSTSSYRPSYERMGKNYGLYATHLCKYLEENIFVTKVFEQVGISIDATLRGAERKQIPMFATTITKPYRLTDSVSHGNLPKAIENLEKTVTFPSKVIEINFQKTGIKCKATISQLIKPYFNVVQVTLSDLDEKYDINFYNSVHTKRNNLFQSSNKYKCWLYSPQSKEGAIVISLLENGIHIGATLLDVSKFVPLLLNKLNQKN